MDKETLDALYLAKNHYGQQSNQEQQKANRKIQEFHQWKQDNPKVKDEKLIEKKQKEAESNAKQYFDKAKAYGDRYQEINEILDREIEVALSDKYATIFAIEIPSTPKFEIVE